MTAEPPKKKQDYSSHQEPAHGTYSGYVDGCRCMWCDHPEHRALHALNAARKRTSSSGDSSSIPRQARREAIPDATGDTSDDDNDTRGGGTTGGGANVHRVPPRTP